MFNRALQRFTDAVETLYNKMRQYIENLFPVKSWCPRCGRPIKPLTWWRRIREAK
jgi:hypothetical protein